MDTIILKDTVFQTLNNTLLTTSEMADIYKEIINSQTQTYNFIIYVFLGIIALFAGATWLYNKKIVLKEIKDETENIFNVEKVKIINDIKTEYEQELNFLKAERARLFALTINSNASDDLLLKFAWWMNAVYYYQIAERGLGTRKGCMMAINVLENILKENNISKEIYDEYITNKESITINEIIEKLPYELNPEKEKLKKMLAEIETGIVKDNKKH